MTAAIILAGGLGTRLRSIVQDVPKPMAPINGRPFLAYQFDYWIAQGIERFVLSVGYKHEKIQDFFKHSYNGTQIDYVVENTPLGTGGGFLLALNRLSKEEPFLLLNGDTYFDVDLNKLKTFANKQRADWTFALFATDDYERYMRMQTTPNGQITSVQTKINNKGSHQLENYPTAFKVSAQNELCSEALLNNQQYLANGGVYWVNPSCIPSSLLNSCNIPKSLENDIFPAILKSGARLFGLECEGTFIDIGLPDDYRRTASILGLSEHV